MTGDNTNKGIKNERKRSKESTSSDSKDPEPVGRGPQVVLISTGKISIYGPHFKHGPPQLRKQKLEHKIARDRQIADDVMEKKMRELEEECRAREEKQKLELIKQQQAAMGKKRCIDRRGNSNPTQNTEVINQIENVKKFSNDDYDDLPPYPEEFEQNRGGFNQFNQGEFIPYQQEFPPYQQEFQPFHQQQYQELSQYPVYQHFQQWPQQDNFFVHQS